MVPSFSADDVVTRVVGVDICVEDNRECNITRLECHAASQDWLFLHPPGISVIGSDLRIT